MICPGDPHQRNPNAPKLKDRSQEETEWQSNDTETAFGKVQSGNGKPETGNRKPEAAKTRSGSRRWGKMVKNGENWEKSGKLGKMRKHEEK